MTQNRSNPAGFTLIELMVSIAIALLLILGVNQVFRISSETVGQGQALSTINRDNRTIQNTLATDFKNVIPVAGGASQTADGPCFIIDSRKAVAFRNARDQAGARDPAHPLNDSTLFANSGGIWNPALLNSRNHRIDRLGFFARGLYARQTAPNVSGARFVSPTTASEAYIWYGHGALAGRNGVFYDPGSSNPLVPIDPANTDNRFASDFFLCREAILLTPNPDGNSLQPNTAPLAPLGVNSKSNDSTVIQDSRYDVAQCSIQQFTTILQVFTQSSTPTNPTDWWDPMIYRFQVNPYLSKPVTAAGMAKASPCLVRGCTQFIVEYAGNFYTKNADGSVKDATTPDPTGQLDFLFDNGVQKIRWYGYPRDTNGDGKINPAYDVVPLSDFIGRAAADAEHFSSNFPMPPQPDYAAGVLPSAASYTAAWGPTSTMPFPKMIRITIAIDDPNGRLSDAQFFEYVFDVQQ